MRDKLIELIIDAKENDPETGSFTEFLADHLLANGIIVLPCRVGDYVEWDNGIHKRLYEIKGFIYRPDDLGLRFDIGFCCPVVNCKSITRIITREEAEAALREVQG